MNFLHPDIHEKLLERFASHKAGNLERALTNTVASQTCCFNLLAPLVDDLHLASAAFSRMLESEISVEHIELEFTPNMVTDLTGFARTRDDESLGDQSGHAGTDADVAVFFRTTDDSKGVVLIEFKYREHEFSTCGAVKKRKAEERKRIRSICRSPQFITELVEGQQRSEGSYDCAYLKYRNWEMTRSSAVLDYAKLRSLAGCPFEGSKQQLWRNMLLAERIAWARELDDFAFWVLSPRDNEALWRERAADVRSEFEALLYPEQRRRFRHVTMESFLAAIELELPDEDPRREWWLAAFKQRYLPGG